jgi:hypothetical protein
MVPTTILAAMMSTVLRPLSALCIVATLVSAAPEEFPLREAVECTPRSGLPNFLSKAESGAEVRIAYLGGSITAQPGWRPKTLAWFQEEFPKARISEINAAIGGTGSDLGVFRLKGDVLDHKPDLMFVEFAVNDGGAAPEQIFRCMEGIVRQTWRTLPGCDICFVYTLTEALATSMLEGRFQRSASAMEKIADHYGIPTIHMAMEAARLAKAGKLVWKGALPKSDAEKAALGDKVVFAPDSVHPFPETGHEMYLAAVKRSFPGIKEASGPPAAPKLAEPFIATNYENARLVPITEAALSAGFEKVDVAADSLGKRFASRLPALHKGGKPGDTIRFSFKGTRAALYHIIGPDCGQAVITLDDKEPRIVPAFDSYCTYHRLSTLLIGSDLPEALHTVELKIHSEPPDKAKILSQRNEKMNDPERFEGTALYPGAILLVGELVK